MKSKIIHLSFLFFTAIAGFGQSSGNVTIYSNTGKKFFVILNGIRQNIIAETNVNVSGLTEEWYNCRVLAEDKSFDIEKNIGVKLNANVTYHVTGKKSKYKLRYYSETPGTGAGGADQVAVNYRDTESPVSNTTTSNGSVNTQNNGTQVNTQNNGTQVKTQSNGVQTNTQNNGTQTTVQSNGTQTTVQTNGTTTQVSGTQSNPGNGSVSIGINMTENGGTINTNSNGQSGTEGFNLNINMNGLGMDMMMNVDTTLSTYETTSTTSTTTTTTVNGVTTTTEQTTVTTNINGNGTTTTTNSGGIPQYNPATTEETITFNNGNCLATDVEMNTFKTAIENESFTEDQMRIAHQAARTKCMSVAQIQEIASLLAFSADQMSFLKAAYGNCINQSDYLQLSSVFTFSQDKEELQNFINSH